MGMCVVRRRVCCLTELWTLRIILMLLHLHGEVFLCSPWALTCTFLLSLSVSVIRFRREIFRHGAAENIRPIFLFSILWSFKSLTHDTIIGKGHVWRIKPQMALCAGRSLSSKQIICTYTIVVSSLGNLPCLPFREEGSRKCASSLLFFPPCMFYQALFL